MDVLFTLLMIKGMRSKKLNSKYAMVQFVRSIRTRTNTSHKLNHRVFGIQFFRPRPFPGRVNNTSIKSPFFE